MSTRLTKPLIALSLLLLIFLCVGCRNKPFDLSFRQVDVGYTHSMGLTDDGKVYLWGSLTADENDIYKKPVLIEFPDLPSYEYIIDIEAGEMQAYAVASNGTVYGWGNGLLGDNTEMERFSPTPITFTNLLEGEKVLIVRSKYTKAGAITNLGRLFLWGAINDSHYDLVLSPELMEIADLQTNEKIADITFGERNFALLTSLGRVYTWGDNSSGSLGDGTFESRWTPEEISFPDLPEDETIQFISSGWAHVIVASENHIFVWGSNYEGQIGDGTKENRPSPTEIVLPDDGERGEKVESLACGGDYTSVIWDDRVFTWGNNELGMLGNGSYESSLKPVEVILPDSINPDNHDAGGGFILLNGYVNTCGGYAWGFNGYYQLGDGTDKNRNQPIRIY